MTDLLGSFGRCEDEGGMDVIKKLITWDMPHCKNCGQRIDWSDEE